MRGDHRKYKNFNTSSHWEGKGWDGKGRVGMELEGKGREEKRTKGKRWCVCVCGSWREGDEMGGGGGGDGCE